jgi:MFS family permease
LHAIKPFAFAANAVASFVSPLIFGAMADREIGPVRVLRWLALATSVAMALAATSIKLGWSVWLVLALIQIHALFTAPTWSITTSIVLARLTNAPRQFGPVRAMGTLGWMAGCWIVSALNADASTVAGYSGAAMWLAVAGFTLVLHNIVPPKSLEHLTLKQRLGLDALTLFKNADHRVVFVTAALVAMPLAAFYPFTPPHLHDLGLRHTTAWMTLGQITEIVAMFGLGALLANWRLKWIFAAGLACAFLRYVLCALNGKAWVLSGVTLHGFACTLFFVTAPIYLDGRVEARR